MKWMMVLATLPLAASDVPRLVYSKSFPGSKPAYVEIAIDRSGAGVYKEAPDDDQPLTLQLSETEATQLFDLADKLDRFSRSLEAPVKVAFMGMKTFRFEHGTEKKEVKFNFSEDLDARALQDWFERISESEQHRVSLERTFRYDKLGVNRELLLLQASWERKRLVSPQQFLPILDRIVKNESIIHMARLRAAGLADAIRAMK
jgi:hypothetical protein